MGKKKQNKSHVAFNRDKQVAIRKARVWLKLPGASPPSHESIINQFVAAASLEAPVDRNDKVKWFVQLYYDKAHPCFGTPTPRKRMRHDASEFYNQKGIGGIYRISCIPTGHFYIGSSSNLQARWMCHLYELMIDCHSNKHLQKAYNTYGESAFAFSVIRSIKKGESRLDLYHLEQHYIDTLNPELNIERQVKIPPSVLNQVSAGHREMKTPTLHG